MSDTLKPGTRIDVINVTGGRRAAVFMGQRSVKVLSATWAPPHGWEVVCAVGKMMPVKDPMLDTCDTELQFETAPAGSEIHAEGWRFLAHFDRMVLLVRGES